MISSVAKMPIATAMAAAWVMLTAFSLKRAWSR
jgi:hypothetical protein